MFLRTKNPDYTRFQHLVLCFDKVASSIYRFVCFYQRNRVKAAQACSISRLTTINDLHDPFAIESEVGPAP